MAAVENIACGDGSRPGDRMFVKYLDDFRDQLLQASDQSREDASDSEGSDASDTDPDQPEGPSDVDLARQVTNLTKDWVDTQSKTLDALARKQRAAVAADKRLTRSLCHREKAMLCERLQECLSDSLNTVLADARESSSREKRRIVLAVGPHLMPCCSLAAEPTPSTDPTTPSYECRRHVFDAEPKTLKRIRTRSGPAIVRARDGLRALEEIADRVRAHRQRLATEGWKELRRIDALCGERYSRIPRASLIRERRRLLDIARQVNEGTYVPAADQLASQAESVREDVRGEERNTNTPQEFQVAEDTGDDAGDDDDDDYDDEYTDCSSSSEGDTDGVDTE